MAFIRKPIAAEGDKESWVLFNDEKVVKADGDIDEMKKFAYVYFFERIWTVCTGRDSRFNDENNENEKPVKQ